MSTDAAAPAPADGSLADRGRRLFEFLARAQLMRNSPARSTASYDQVLWMRDLPSHPQLQAVHHQLAPEPGTPLLTIDRIPALAVPEVPAVLRAWLEGPTDVPDSEPVLRESIPNPKPQAEDGSDAHLRLNDQAQVVRAYTGWLQSWRAWAQQEQVDRPIRELYQVLFSMYVKVTTHNEELELTLGTALLAWAPNGPASAVCRHLLTCPARMDFNDSTGVITITAAPTLETLALEIDMLDPSLVPNPAHTDTIRTLAREYDGHPMDVASVGEIARRFVNALDADAQYEDSLSSPTAGPAPRAAFAPAFIVRKRSAQGLVDVFRSIAAEIASTGEVPEGLVPLLDPDQAPSTELETTPGAMVSLDDAGVHDGSDGEVFLPLPLNPVQLEIIRRVDRSAQTLVQGPPGTGKTHTAAALITHLLAQGKRVLVTAHTDRALKEVRGKLPESVKPLAVAVVGTDQSDMADLKVAVERIASRSSDNRHGDAQWQIQACLDNIDDLRRRRAAIRTTLLTARQSEVTQHEHGPYDGTLAKIAQQYQADAPAFEWLTQCVTPGADDPCPLDEQESGRWLKLLRDDSIGKDLLEAGQRLPVVDDLVTPEQFSELIDAEERGEAGMAAHSDLASHQAYTAVAALPAAAREALRTRMQELARKASELEQRDQSWMSEALHDIRAGRRSMWTARATDIRAMTSTVSPIVESLPIGTEVTATGTDPATLVGLATGVLEHLRGGGAVKTNPDGTVKVGFTTPKVIKSAKPFFDAVRVNRQVPVSAEHISAFLAHTEAQRQLDVLDKAWPASVTVVVEDTVRERLAWHQTELEQLDRLLALSSELETEEHHLAQAGLGRPDWNDISSVLTYARLVDAATASETAKAATAPLEMLAAITGATAVWETAAPVAKWLHAAVTGRDRDAYAAAFARVQRLYAVRDLAADRDSLTARVTSAAPDLAATVTAGPHEKQWTDQVPALPQAWAWASTGSWILDQDATDTNVLQAQINSLEVRIRRECEVLAATRAWAHAVSPDRLTGTARADLTQYAQLVKRLGKGTGKYAIQRRGEIRQAMDRCRPAVPVWILPIYRIAEQLRVQQNMFDVVIVDEASQAGLEATFLQYLAPKIVIIGDDKQVSPAGVGVDQQQLRDLADQFLFDDRFLASWHDPKRSLFDEANMRFGQKLTLVEHRRCVPEIIGFSNRIAYEPENIHLVPVRQFGAERLEPIKAVHVSDGYERGVSGNKTNPAEVDAIVDQVLKCLADPRYDGLTFGIISLSGARQARALQDALLKVVPAEEWAARELRCGDAADFQGSERDVVFLSMVSAPEDGQRLGALTQEMYVQRYNVAASRAKDQLWLFHSITIDQVPNSGDMRHHLLDYCYGVISRAANADGSGSTPVPDDIRVEPFDSLFEQRVFNKIVDRGFTVIPQYQAIGYNLDLVIVGAKGRLAIECDGDAWHGPDAFEADLGRQRDLERCGWQFFRIRESAWYVDQHKVLEQLWETLEQLDIRPSGWLEDLTEDDDATDTPDNAIEVAGLEPAVELTHTAELEPTAEPERATRPDAWLPTLTTGAGGPAHADEVATADAANDPDDDHESVLPSVADLNRTMRHPVDLFAAAESTPTAPVPPEPALRTTSSPEAGPTSPYEPRVMAPYVQFAGTAPNAMGPRPDVVDALRAIVAAEGPAVGYRLHRAYVGAAGGQRVGKQIGRALNMALADALRRGVLVADNPLNEAGIRPRTFRLPDSSDVIVRKLGPRTLDEVPPMELAHLLRDVATVTGWDSTETLFREALHLLGRGRLSAPATARLTRVLGLARALDERN